MSVFSAKPIFTFRSVATLWLLVALLFCVARPTAAADLTFDRAYQGSLSGQTFTTTTALNADAGTIRFADGGTQRSFQNTSGTLYYKIGGVQFSEAGVLNSRYPNGNTIMNAVAFSGTGGDRLLVLGGTYTTSGSYGGSSNAIVAKLNEYVDATAPDPAQTTLLVNGGSSATVAVGATATIVVTAKLTSGAALSGAVVTVTGSPGAGSSISPASATTNVSGQASFTVQGLQSGTVTYSATASANGTTTTSAGTASVTYSATRSAAQTTASVPAGTAGAATTVVVTVRDTGGALVTGAASGLAATIGGTNAGATVSAVTDTGNGTYRFTYTPASAGVDSVAITLDGGAISGSPYSSTVSAPALAITTATLPTPVIGVAYSQTVATSGGTAPVSFSVSVGALPAGLSLNAATGAITGTATAAGAYSFTITATDTNNVTATKAYSGTIGAALAITTTTLPTPVIGVAYSQTVATSGGTAPVSFSVSVGALPAGLSLNAATGAITGTATAAGAYSFTITATDTNNVTATQAYSGTIGAGLAITTVSLPTPVIGVAYSQTVATSGGAAPVSFSVSVGALPAGLSLNAATGAITGTATAAGAYSFTITATDTNNVTATQAYSGTIGADLAITTVSLPTPVIGVAYSQTVATSGGAAPVSFSVSAGALPAGLSLNAATGAITGTATAAGAYSFTITATDTNNVTATQAYSGTIGAGLAITTTSLPTPVIGVAYSQTVVTSGGLAPVTFSVSAGSLPAGLSLNASTGAITGAATGFGAYSFAVTATDANTTTAMRTYSGTIIPALAITRPTLPTPVIGVSYSQAVSTSGGAAPVVFTVSGGTLPAGLSLDASAGVISGAPTAPGPYGFTITATDAQGVTAARGYSGTIGFKLEITTLALPTPKIDAVYSETVSTSGGAAPLAFSVSAGALPAGLSLIGATGLISGAATTAGPYGFTIQAIDNAGLTAAQAYSGAIAPSLVITTTSLPAPAIGVPYGQTIATSGGSAPTTFSISAGSLPAGLTLNPATGAITGTVASPGGYAFTVKATDAKGAAASQAYSGSITASLVITTTSLPAPLVAVAYSQAITTSGSQAAVTFALSGGALPAGLSLDRATGTIGGAATAPGVYDFAVTATDANGLTASRSYSVSVRVGLEIVTTSLPTTTVGQTVDVALAVTGGAAPYGFAITGGALPAGLSLSAAGEVKGAPTTPGPFSVTVEVTDGEGNKTARIFTGAVFQALSAEDRNLEVAFDGSASVTLASLGAGEAIALQSNVASGKLGLVGGVATYSPNAGFIGADGFTFSVKGPQGQSRVASVKIKVLPPPPPTAEPPPKQTLDTSAEDDAAVVVDKVSFDLASLVKGVVSDVQIATPPSHGKVELVRLASAAAISPSLGASDDGSRAAAAPAAPVFTAVYTADKGYVGRDSFTFVAVGPGGRSAPAMVNIEVVKSRPSAPVLKVSALGGRTVVVDLTAAAQDGPFVAAALVSQPPASAGTARLIEGGTAADRRYSLEFTPKGAATGEVRFTYTLTNSSGVSDPLTVILTVEPRKDPTLDAGVRGVSDAQAAAARRFASAQMDNFSRRLERLHGDQRAGGLGLTVGSGVGGGDGCRSMARTPEDQHQCRESEVGGASRAGPQGPRALGEVELWTGGAITVGRRDPDSGRAKLSVQTSGVSGGADVRVSPVLTLGVGGGYAADVSKLGQGLGRVEAKGWTAAGYASFHPASGAFIDGVAGVGDLTFDTRRAVAATGETAYGQRDAALRFGALTAGYDGEAGRALWSMYLRAKAVDGRLKAYAEHRSQIYSLAFDQRDLRSRVGVIGGRLGFSYKVGDAIVTPRGRVEYGHEFAGIDPQRIRYADWLDGAVYDLGGMGWRGDRVTLELGAGVDLGSGWSLDLDLGGEKVAGLTSASGRIGAARRF